MTMILPTLLFFSYWGGETDACQRPDPIAVHFIDLDGDGKLDRLLCFGDGTLVTELNQGNRVYSEFAQPLPRVLVSDMISADLNGDCLSDLYLVSWEANVALLGDGTGGLRDATEELGLGDTGFGIRAESLDVDGDGIRDVLLHNWGGDVLFWGAPRGGFERDPNTPTVMHGSDASILTWGPSAEAARPAASATSPGAAPMMAFPTCAKTIEDQGTSICLHASSTPTLGELYPLSSNLFVDPSGNIGLGTVSPGAKLDVVGSIAIQSGTVINASGQWVGSPTGLVGPQGPPGPIGPTGPPGSQGLTGPAGPGVLRVIRGTASFASTTTSTTSSFSPSIDPAKSMTLLSSAVQSGGSGTTEAEAAVTSLGASSITIQIPSHIGTMLVGYQIIQYE